VSYRTRTITPSPPAAAANASACATDRTGGSSPARSTRLKINGVTTAATARTAMSSRVYGLAKSASIRQNTIVYAADALARTGQATRRRINAGSSQRAAVR
jgi:hypothetical protein